MAGQYITAYLAFPIKLFSSHDAASELDWDDGGVTEATFVVVIFFYITL
jgi:hypothetical protein